MALSLTAPSKLWPLALLALSCGSDSTPSDDATVGPVFDASTNDGANTDGGLITTAWSASSSLVDDLGRLAIGNQVHVVGHTGGQLIHRTSADDGVTWGNPTVIAPAAGNFPGMYGGLFSQGDNVYLITAPVDMGGGPQQIDFRRSADNGASWTAPVRLTSPTNPLMRARIVANDNYIHVVGGGQPTPQATVWYFRSTNSGVSWEPGVSLASNLGGYGGGQTVAVDGATVHVPYTTAVNGVGGGPSMYVRSANNGASWSTPVEIGEKSVSSKRQARVQIVAVDGKVFACWQREGEFTGAPLPADRLGYNRSDDGGLTWGTAQILPEDSGVNRNHQQVWMASGGGVHILWRHGDGASDPAGYMYSPNYGASWQPGLTAINTAEANHPFSIVADQDAVHAITAPAGQMQYARRPLR